MTEASLPGGRLALISDVHGRTDLLRDALDLGRDQGVGGVVLLGDLFDRADEADACVAALAGWDVFGVAGNHERDALAGAALTEEAAAFFRRLGDRLAVGDVLFAHEPPRVHIDPQTAFFQRRDHVMHHRDRDPEPGREPYRVIFVGHTHHRAARDQHGPLHIGHDLRLRPGRRYVINPGALVGGEFAIWDREDDVVHFRRVGPGRGAGRWT